MFGYTGKFLRVNLETEKISKEDTPEELIHNFLGGDGFAIKVLYDELKAQIDPFSPENKIIITTGPLTSTNWPASGRIHMATKSPLTNFWGEGNAGGFFGPELKFAGYDFLLIEGKAKKPVYLRISDSDVRIESAENLWSKDTYQVNKFLLQRYPQAQTLVIGQAGENRVRYASVIGGHHLPRGNHLTGLHGAFGRSGLGAVWGAKNLKAIVVRGNHLSGNRKVKIAQPSLFSKLIKQAQRKVLTNPQAKQLHKYGTNLLLDYKQALGELPTRHHTAAKFEDADKLSTEYINKNWEISSRTCFACPIACKKIYKTKPSSGLPIMTVEGPEYHGTVFFGPNLGIADFSFILHACDLCNKYGIDQVSLGSAIAFLIECYQNGLVSKIEVDGLNLSWGNKEAILSLIEKTVKREGIGDLLSEGVKRASKKLGRGSEKYALHIKGQEIPAQDARVNPSAGLTQAVSARGADHLRSLMTTKEVITSNLKNKLKDVAYQVKINEDFYALRDALIVCWYTCGNPQIFTVKDFAQVLLVVTGEEFFSRPKELMKIGERIVNLKRAFNLREGLTVKDDTLPNRFLKEALFTKKGKKRIAQLEPLLNYYYQFRGWDRKTGKIKVETLKRLNLKL